MCDFFTEYFVEKILKIRKDMFGANRRNAMENNVTNTDSNTNCKWSSFKIVIGDDVRKIVLSTKSKSCSQDSISNSLLQKCMDSLLPFITKIVNLSLLGIMP